jgi:hypothetical protein
MAPRVSLSGVMADTGEVREVDKLISIVRVHHFVLCGTGLPEKSSKSGRSDASGRTGTMHARMKTARIDFRGRMRDLYDVNFQDKNCKDENDCFGRVKSRQQYYHF